MSVEELQEALKDEKRWISSRLATIDKLLDRAAYGNSRDEEELTEEYDNLEIRFQKLTELEKSFNLIVAIDKHIATLESYIDNLACYVGNEAKIANIEEEIEESEARRSDIISKLQAELKIEEKKKTNLPRR